MSYKILEARNYHVVTKMLLSPWSLCDIEIFGSSLHAVGFSGGSDGKESACNAGDLGLIPGLRGSPGEGNGNPLQCSCLENFMDRGARWATQPMGLQIDTIDQITLSLYILWVKIFSFTWLSQGHQGESARESVKPVCYHCSAEFSGEEPSYLSSMLSVKTCFLII